MQGLTVFARNQIELKSGVLIALLLLANSATAQIPAEFIDVRQVVRGVTIDLRYFSRNNFVGEFIDGYEESNMLMTRETAAALIPVENQLRAMGLGLKIFDAYRPQQAVDHFVRWAEDLDDTRMKYRYYPNVDKANLFSDGYIAARSGHSRGSTVDLTIIDRATGDELDMGTPWDFFDLRSWPSSTEVSATQRANRMLLRTLIIEAGFRPLETEWWHFTLENEPFPDTYFNFVIQ